jgi:hypothetical protein
MSSVQSYIANTPSGLTKFIYVNGPGYDDSSMGGIEVLFPFTYSNGVLDLNINPAANSFEADMIDISNNGPSDSVDVAVKLMGGLGLVRALGPNFLRYIRAWRDGSIDANSPITIYTPGVMTKVQQIPIGAMTDEKTATISSEPPTSTEYVSGNQANNFMTAWVFKHPLTITILESGIIQYITFSTVFDRD